MLGSVRLLRGDLLDQAFLARELEAVRADVCFHFAWYAVPGRYLRSLENLRSLETATALAVQLARLGCSRFVGIGTCLEYDVSHDRLSEASPTRPNSVYAATKLAYALLLEQIAATEGMRYTWTRLFHQYGPREDARRLVPTVVRALLTGERALLSSGEQVRDFLHVEDVVAGIEAAAGSLDGAVNIGSGIPVRVADIVQTIGDLTGRTELIALGVRPQDPTDPMYICADSSRLQSTGWRPAYNLETGLLETIEWWRQALAAGSRDGRSEGSW